MNQAELDSQSRMNLMEKMRAKWGEEKARQMIETAVGMTHSMMPFSEALMRLDERMDEWHINRSENDAQDEVQDYTPKPPEEKFNRRTRRRRQVSVQRGRRHS